MTSYICIYNGPGAEDVQDYEDAYSKILSDEYSFRYVNATDIIEKDVLNEDCALLVMPGGADIPYCEALNGSGNEIIREWVKQGGRYFGTCAGAYYGTEYVVFDEKNQVGQRILGERELKFFPGLGRGPLFKSVPHANEYDNPISVTVCLNEGVSKNYTITDKYFQAYYFGGPFLEYTDFNAQNISVEFLADYLVQNTEDLFIVPEKAFHLNPNNVRSLPAIIYSTLERGKIALSGVHLENGLFDAENEHAPLNREEMLKIIFKKLGLNLKDDVKYAKYLCLGGVVLGLGSIGGFIFYKCKERKNF